MARPRQMVFALVISVSALACTEPSTPTRPFYVVLTGNGPAVGRVVQQARPDSCAPNMQPAIVDFEGAARVPIWSCLRACKPANEYVTNALAEYDPASPTQLEPSCQPLCAAGTHRLTYVDFGHKAHCAAGDPDPTTARALSEEQRRIAEDFDQRETLALDQVEKGIETMERAPQPWTDESLLETYNETGRLLSTAAFEFEDLGSGGLYALTTYPHDCKTKDRPACDRVHALASRLSGLESPRQVASSARKSRRRSEKSLTQCTRDCEIREQSCSRACNQVPGGACDACRVEVTSCRKTCG